jgi:hypothetical protein
MSDVQTAIDQDTEIKLQVISMLYGQSKDNIVKKLLDCVILVPQELHQNLAKVEL